MCERPVARIACLFLLLLCPTARLQIALSSVVQVTASFTVRGPGGEERAYLSQGSGWTTSCRPAGAGYRITVRTAAHVVDPGESLRLAGLDGSWTLVGVSYQVDYRDGSRYGVYPGVFLRGAGDSATLEFFCPVRKPSLPDGDPRRVQPGDRLWTVACPEGMRFLAADGVFSATLGQAGISDALPPGWRDSWWLATPPAMPGSSGAPVLDEQGLVVAHIVGRLEWLEGTLSVLQPQEVRP